MWLGTKIIRSLAVIRLQDAISQLSVLLEKRVSGIGVLGPLWLGLELAATVFGLSTHRRAEIILNIAVDNLRTAIILALSAAACEWRIGLRYLDRPDRASHRSGRATQGRVLGLLTVILDVGKERWNYIVRCQP